MAYSLCPLPPSSLYQPLCSSLTSSSNTEPPRKFSSFKSYFVPTQPRKTSLLITNVSLQEATKDANLEHPIAKIAPPLPPPSSSSKPSYIWVNPNSPRASQLKKRSHNSRYASLVKAAKALNSCDANKDDVFSVLNSLGDGLLEQEAVVIVNNMSNPETALLALGYFLERLNFDKEVIIYNVTMKVFKKCGDLDGAQKLFEEMLERGIKPDNATFSTLINCARLSNLPGKAVEWFEKMPDFGLNPDKGTYSPMIDAYGRAGNVEMALSLYDRARTERWRLDAVTVSGLIKIYGVSGNFDGCLNVYAEMKALGTKPNLVIYNTLLDAMGRGKRPWQAKKIYRDMIVNGISPSFVTYAALLRAYGRCRYGEDALKVYGEMKEKGLQLNVILYNTLLSMCADLGYVDEAFKIYEDMKSSGTKPDSWTFSSLVTIHSCSGKVSEAENTLNEMVEAGFEPDVFVLTSLIQCYGKAQLTSDIVRTFNRAMEMGIVLDDRFCGCLLNVMNQTPRQDLSKLVQCIEMGNSKLGCVVKLLVEEQGSDGNFKQEAAELLNSIGSDVKKAYCNGLIDLCANFNKLEQACELLYLGLAIGIYTDIQSRSSTQWSLHLKSLSVGAALTALHAWINDLSRALESGDELPPVLGINTGHGKHKYSDKGLASVFESHLKELEAPFHEAPDKFGWFLTTKIAAESWLKSRKSTDVVAA